MQSIERIKILNKPPKAAKSFSFRAISVLFSLAKTKGAVLNCFQYSESGPRVLISSFVNNLFSSYFSTITDWLANL